VDVSRIHKDLGAFWIGIHLRPGNGVADFSFNVNVKLSLDVILDLDAPGICLVAGQPQHQIVICPGASGSVTGVAPIALLR